MLNIGGNGNSKTSTIYSTVTNVMNDPQLL